jgi:DNA-binding NtrC family response regulator
MALSPAVVALKVPSYKAEEGRRVAPGMWSDLLSMRTSILVVATDPATRGLICRALRPDHRVLQAANAQEAVRIAAQHRRDIDLLVTDVKLPLLNGWELLELLTLDYPKLDVVYFARSLDADIRAHVRRNKLVLLEHPFPTSRLLDAVREVLQNARSVRPHMQQPAASPLLRMRSYLRRHFWMHRPAS